MSAPDRDSKVMESDRNKTRVVRSVQFADVTGSESGKDARGENKGG